MPAGPADTRDRIPPGFARQEWQRAKARMADSMVDKLKRRRTGTYAVISMQRASILIYM